jgi:hypothetical protein
VACGGDLSLPAAFSGQDLTREWQPQFDPDQPLPDIEPFSVESAIAQTFSVYTTNFWTITKIVAGVVAPFEIFRALNFVDITNQLELTFWAMVLNGACKVLVVPALIHALMKIILTDETPGIHESYRWGLTKLWKFGICAVIVSVAEALGYAMLIIPGIIVSLVFILVYPISVLENGSIAETFGRSIELTRGHRLQIFVPWIVIGVLLLVTNSFGSSIAEAVAVWPVVAAVGIITNILDQAMVVLSLVIYLSLPRMSVGGQSLLSVTK